MYLMKELCLEKSDFVLDVNNFVVNKVTILNEITLFAETEFVWSKVTLY